MTTPIKFGHPLHGAELRLERARRLIGTMHRQYARWAVVQAEGGFEQKFDRSTGNLTISPASVDARHIYVPRISITVDEVAYNIRAALDYLVFSIAGACNKGKPVVGTQFPIEDSKSRYWGRWTGIDTKTGKPMAKWLNKIPEDVAKDLANYQPFSHCRWAELLRDISNVAKHRHLTTLTTATAYRPNRPVFLLMDTDKNQQSVHLRGHFEVGVFLPTGEDIIDAANLIQGETRALIRRYAGRFTLPGPRFI